MKIRMYNVGFGDCFCLRDRKNSLLVDFGTNNSRIEGRPRKEAFDVIISDLTTIERKNLLLTHFHLDHLSGLLYLMKYRSSSYEFGRIYLPDVFSDESMTRTLVLLFLADLAKDSCLPSRQVSLFALMEALAQNPQKVELLSRGKVFEEKYQALWPDKDVIRKETDEVYEMVKEHNEEALKVLWDFVEKLRKMVSSMTGEVEAVEEISEAQVRALDKELREMKATPEFKELIAFLETNKVNLRQFKHKISIVFQNARDGELNLLLPGMYSRNIWE